MQPIRITAAMLVLLVLIIGSGLYSNKALAKTANKFESQINDVENNIASGNWEEAQDTLDFVEKDWSRTQKTWTMLLDHVEIDNIDATLSRMTKYIEAQDEASALAETATLRQYINHIPEKEAFKLENIL